MESQFKQEGVHVYVAKEQPLKKVKTDEVKEYQDLCHFFLFILVHIAVVRVQNDAIR